MFGSKPRAETVGLSIQDICDIALLPQLDVLAIVPRNLFVSHPGKQPTQFLWVGMCEFDELESIGASWIFGGYCRFRRVMRKRAHDFLLISSREYGIYSAFGAQYRTLLLKYMRISRILL
jgi:hypothetical protein